jgi:endoglucanase
MPRPLLLAETRRTDSSGLRMYTRLAMSNLKFRFGFLFLLPLLFQGLTAQKGFVHTAGSDLVDGNGKTLMLRGTNLGNWFEPEGYMFHFKSMTSSIR